MTGFSDFILAHEPTVRFAIFAGLLVLFAVWEAVMPRRVRAVPRLSRWIANGAMMALSALLLRIAFPVLAVATGLWAAEAGFGLFNLVAWPFWLELTLGLLLLDFLIYLQHLLSHRIPVLWRIHRVHHTDRDVDVTTALRFHPVEIAFSMLYKMALVALFGIGAVTVILFEILLNATALFNHQNVRLGTRADSLLRLLIVTPDMHRVHHSTNPHETDRNFGFCLSVWDRLLRTYKAQPDKGHDAMTIGLAEWQDERPTHTLWSLALPFRALHRSVKSD